MGGQLRKSTNIHIMTKSQNANDSPLVYAILTELPAVFLLYDSSFWSGAFLLLIFAVSVWNGGGFYIEVFGRKYVLSRLSAISLYKTNSCALQVRA